MSAVGQEGWIFKHVKLGRLAYEKHIILPKNALRSNLIPTKFQKFSWGAFSQTPLTVVPLVHLKSDGYGLDESSHNIYVDKCLLSQSQMSELIN